MQIAFSGDDIKGGIYYWTTSQVGEAETAIMSFDFASADQVAAQRVVGPEMTGGHCVGCHALSRDGVKLLTSSEGSYDAMILLLDLSTGEPIVPWNTPPPSAFSSWNPDGTQYVGVFADETAAGWQSYDLNIFDGETGGFVESIPVGGSETQPANHPDWSPDGNRIAYTQVGQAANTVQGTLAFALQCSLRMVTRPSAGEAFGEPVELTLSAAGESTYYPTFSPEGDLIAFNRSTCAGGQNGEECDAYDDPGASLLLIEPEPGATPIELARANAPGPTDARAVVENSFPKWAPFTFAREADGSGRLHWMTFSSDRNYGLRTPEPGRTLIWMAAVDPDLAAEGADGSYPALALPFQDLTTDNHTAQWAEKVVDVD
jgi:WD40-like Beta Propeller Repeat